MKHIIICLTLLFCVSTIKAQIDKNLDYTNHAAEVRKEVWAWQRPEFERRDIPTEFSGASSVILAYHNEIVAKSQKKIRFSLANIVSANSELYYVHTVRQLVKINDQAALDEYSEFSIQQLRKRGGRHISNTMLTIAGVRVIKADGSIQEVNMDEAVMTKDEKTDKQSKIAISGLQVGDLIDYFIRVEEQMDNKDIDPLLFVFGDEIPILSYTVHCEIGNRFTVEYRSMNDAPDFTQSTNADNDFVLDAGMTDIAGMPLELWMSPVRQIPILRLHILDNNQGSRRIGRSPGTIHPNIDPQLIIDETTTFLGWQIARYNGAALIPYFTEINKLVKEYKQTHTTNPDSIAQLVYYALRHYILNSNNSENVVVDIRRNYRTVNNILFMVAFERTLHQLKIPCKYIYLTSRYGPRLDQILSISDINLAISTVTDRPMVFFADGVFTPANYIPAEYEGQQAPAMSVKKVSYVGETSTQKEGTIDIPVSDAAVNSQFDVMKIRISADNPDELLISRTTTLRGNLKNGHQQGLLSFEEYELEERKAIGIKTNIFEDLEKGNKTKSLVSEYILAFQEARKKQKEQYEMEMNALYEVKPKDVSNYKVIQNGTMHQHPDFIYTMDCVVDGWVKKAGNNYLVDAGKFIGSQLTIKPSERKRATDIYMPCARTFKQNIELEIPDGYAAEGLENLNKETRNQTGEFTAVVRQDGNKVHISVTKIYAHEFEPVEHWPQVLEIIDTANEWSNQKIMLRKL